VLIRKRFEIGPSMLNLTDISEITSDMILKFRTRIVLNPDWTVSTTTLSDGYEWVSTPSVKIGLVSIPLPMVSDMILNSNQKDINSGIDHALMEYFDLLSAMKQVWKEIQVPIRITGEYPIWAKITPYEIRAVPITALSGVIRFTAGIKARSELFYGNEPEYQVSDSLPFLKITSLLENDFNLNLVLDIPFRHINDLTQQQLAGFRMTEGKYTVTVKDVFLYGNGDNLVVALNVDGSIRGTIYLTGKPLYDPEKRSITVAGLDFDIRTKNVLLKSASWIFHHGLIKAIASKLEFPVGDQLQLIRKSVQSYLDQDTKLDYFRISGNLDKLDIQGILITKSSVKAVFNLSGKISVSLN
jgi:hypothetical protein